MLKILKRAGLYHAMMDVINYIAWIRTIKREESNPSSFYNKVGFKHNIFYNLYVPISIDEQYKDENENRKRLLVVQELTPIHQYLDEELRFAEYIVPEFNQFVDEKGEPTLTYGIVYIFAFKRITLWWLVKWSALVSLAIWAILEFDLLQKAYSWILSLM
jgi:hypothetical protein